MQPGNKFIRNLREALMPNQEAPTLGKVIRSYEGPGKNKYSVDVRVLDVGSLEETERVISEVPISPIWADRKKRGVYVIPNEGQILIIGFLWWNPAYPYVQGFWSNEYEADAYGKDQFVVTDGEGMWLIIDSVQKKITMDNGEQAVITWEKDKITLDNGKLVATLNKDKLSVNNGSKSLFTVIDTALDHMATLAQNIAAHKTVGSPALHVVDPGDIVKFTLDKTNFTKDKTELAAIMEA
jgi:hypothetical protein